MTNKERQKSLDKSKWLLSESEGKDKSGSMWYCNMCGHQTKDGCNAAQEERESKCLCAKAYNRAKRSLQ